MRLRSRNDWRIVVHQIDDSALIVRYDNASSRLLPKSVMSTCVKVVASYQSEGQDGLPSPEALSALDKLEDAVVSEADSDARLVAITTGGGHRTWILYASTMSWISEFTAALGRQFPTINIHVRVEADGDASVYRQLRASRKYGRT
jgi:hypothetical protein